jgi:predicted ATPase/DNA-binding SARP family transcriptional activator
VGREAETAELLRLLAASRLLTLTGAGGSGKTRLALQVATRLVADEALPVTWVDLAPLGSPDLLAQQVGAALGVTGEGDGLDALVRALPEHRSVLVLDNCEHLVDGCAQLAEELLRRRASLTILATSREALGVPGERAWLVPPLAVPHDRHTRRDDVERSVAAQLFVERARDAAAGFRLTDENAAAVAEVCRRLDGLPLALELAASWVRVLSPRQIADRLGDALRLLAGGRRTAVPRQQTLRAALDWSYALLSPTEQLLLQRFSVFAGSFTVEAAEAACGGDGIHRDDVLDLLSSLVDKSLVAVQERDGAARYRLQEVVRQFAAERLGDAGGTAQAHARHLRYFLGVAEELGARIMTRAEQAAVDGLVQEHDDLRAALRWTLEQGDALSAARLALPLWSYWSHRGSRSEGEYWLREVCAAGSIDDAAVRARLRFALGTAVVLRFGWAEAEPLFQECLQEYRALDDRVMIARTLMRLSSVATGQGDLPAAKRHIEESWVVVQGTGDRGRMSEVLNSRGRVAEARGELAAAAESYELGVALARESGDPGLGAIVSNLGVVALEMGDLARARAAFVESLAWMQQHRRGRYVVYPLSSLACVLVRQGEPERAAPIFGAAEALFAAHSVHLHPRDRPRYDAAMAAARARLGPEAWELAWERGQAMTQDEATRYALEAAEAAAPPAPAAAAADAPDGAPPAGEGELRVRSLGGFEVLRGGVPMDPAEWTHARPRELLLYLLCHPQGRTREQIGLVFWPDSSAAQVKNSFHVALHRLRKTAGHAGLVELENGRYRVNPAAGITFDAAEFERDVTAALRALRGGTDAAAALEAALALYGGDFLEGETVGDWHLEVHDRLRRLYVDGLSALADAQAAGGDHETAARTLERLVQKEDLDEDAHRRLMRALAQSGRRDRALRHFEQLAALLRRELDADPDPETAGLAREIRDARAAPGP